MRTSKQIMQKLRRPPAVHNWVKNIRLRRDDTAFALYNFAMNPPRSSLVAATSICAQIVTDQISLTQALKCVAGIKDASARDRAQWIVRAFHPFAERKGWKGIQVFRDMVEYYPVAAGVRVPVRPTFVVNDGGSIAFYFVIGWAKMNLTTYQRRILSTLIQEAILSLEDFQDSEAHIICTPVSPYSKKERNVITWNVRAFDPLSEEEKEELFERYSSALNMADAMIIDSLG